MTVYGEWILHPDLSSTLFLYSILRCNLKKWSVRHTLLTTSLLLTIVSIIGAIYSFSHYIKSSLGTHLYSLGTQGFKTLRWLLIKYHAWHSTVRSIDRLIVRSSVTFNVFSARFYLSLSLHEYFQYIKYHCHRHHYHVWPLLYSLLYKAFAGESLDQ